MTEYTAQEIATLQSRLDKQLGPEYISSRAGPGGSKVHYLAADKAISLANEVFGFNGWSSSIQNIQIDFVDENSQTGKISLGLSVIVRITLKDGTYHEDIGYGQIENCKGKAAAFEKAKKEGTTDALKRALRNFGNVLGNCVYDKSYLAKVTKLKVGAAKWDEGMLHRHSDFAPKKDLEEVKPKVPVPVQAETPEFEDSFEMADFEAFDFDMDDMRHPDEVSLPLEPASTTKKTTHSSSERSIPTTRTDLTTPSKPASGDPGTETTKFPQVSAPINVVPQPLPGQRATSSAVTLAKPPRPDTRFPLDDDLSLDIPPPRPGQTVGFYSAKAAEKLDEKNSIVGDGNSAVPRFNPHAESPSIRKTSGVNHNQSAPLKRDLSVGTKPVRKDVLNPQIEQARRVGSPGPGGSFAGIRGPSTSAYRPPTRRGPPEIQTAQATKPTEAGTVDRMVQGVKRNPLGDVSNVQHHVTSITADGTDAKRQRVADDGQYGDGGMTNNQGGNTING